MNGLSFFAWAYALVMVVMALYGFNTLILTALAAWAWWRTPLSAETPLAPLSRLEANLPTLLVQLPIYNERYVVERLIDATCALDYPTHLLTVQVLDDSTDDTAIIAKKRVAYHQARGRKVQYHHRPNRVGYKAGALSEGLALAPGELVAVFDADFVPPPDFLRRMVAPFANDPRLGVTQARWAHLNPDENMVAGAASLALDSYFTVEQVARSRFGLWLNFNGSAGVWRRAAIEDAGHWRSDTLAEDLDLSYRAQLRGWRVAYLPEVAAPAEIPASILALKRQQARWAQGAFQVLRQLGGPVFRARLPLGQKAQALLHLSGYVPHPLMILALLLSLPAMFAPPPFNWGVLGVAGLGPVFAFLFGPLVLYPSGFRRWRYFPALILIGIGLALVNTRAAFRAFRNTPTDFLRTPKQPAHTLTAYTLPLDWTTWGELTLSVYAGGLAWLATHFAPPFVPFLGLYALGFGYTAALGLWQQRWQVAIKQATD